MYIHNLSADTPLCSYYNILGKNIKRQTINNLVYLMYYLIIYENKS